MNLKFYDFEVYPNWWCVVVSDELPENDYKSIMYHCRTDKEEELKIKSMMRVYTCEQPDVVNRLKQDMSKECIAGYNNRRYDDIILKCVLMNFTPRQIYIASNLLIAPETVNMTNEALRISNYIKYGWDGCEASQDFIQDSFKGLKDKEASYGLDIRETTVPFNKENLTEQDKKDIIFYCKHDVYALHVHYSSVARAYVDTKLKLSQIFDIPLRTAYMSTNAILSGKVLDAQRVHGTTIKDPTLVIYQKELDAYFKKYIPREAYTHLLISQSARSFTIYENKVDIADGGLHSVLILPKIGRSTSALYVESTDTHTMFNIDASSCYTSVMIYCDAMARGIRNPKRLIHIYDRRMKLKATPKSQWSEEDRYFVPAGKLVLNTTYGAMGNEYLPLYDDYMRSKTCRIGQMILIALSNSLFQNVPDIKVLQNNTDGVLIYARRDQKDIIQKVVDELSEISKFIFEVEEDAKIWQVNVNNYLAIDPKGNLKDKGAAFITDIHQPGYYHIRPLSSYGVVKAQIHYYMTGQNPVKHLIENTKVSDFCLTGTKGPTYHSMIQYTDAGVVELGKVCRMIAVTDESLGVIKKLGIIKKDQKYKSAGDTKEDLVPLCPPHPLVVNDALYNYEIVGRKLVHKDGRQWDIDYSYYCKELDKALNYNWYELKNSDLKHTRRFNL